MNVEFTLHFHILLLESSNPHVDTPVHPKVHWLKINPEIGDIYWMYVSSPLSFGCGMEVQGENSLLRMVMAHEEALRLSSRVMGLIQNRGNNDDDILLHKVQWWGL